MKSTLKKSSGKSGSDRDNKNDTTIWSTRHIPRFDSYSISNAVERAIKDERFLNYALGVLKPLKFPAFKQDIIQYLKRVTDDKDVISLLESLDGYVEFKDIAHVRKAIEENNPEKKNTYPNTIPRTTNTRIRQTKSKGIKETEAVNQLEERKDYPEVTPTAASVFVCNVCGKHFQGRDELVQHQRFEGTPTRGEK